MVHLFNHTKQVMKTNSILIFAILFLVSCTSSQKLLDEGQYDRAIDKAVEELRENPGDSEELAVLKEAFELTKKFDVKHIESLKLRDNDKNLTKIIELYERLDRRQDKIRGLPSQVINQFTFVNYDGAIADLKSGAAYTSYQRGLEYMDRGDKKNYRLAWAEFIRVSELSPGYEDVDQLIEEARILGTNNVLFEVENSSGVVVPEYFTTELSKITLQDLNTRWLTFNTIENENISYDYQLVLNVASIVFSPESEDRQLIQETNEIQDGFYVKKDSLGNEIRIPNIVTVSATVVNVTRTKSAFVGGSLNIHELATDQLVYTENLSEEFVFENRYREYSGDERASAYEPQRMTVDDRRRERLTPDEIRSKKIEVGKEVQFPSDEQLLLDSADLIKLKARAIIQDERNSLEG